MPKTDEELVAEVVATRSSVSFETLVERHHSKVRNWLRQLSRDHALADDLAQEVFLIAWRKTASYRGDGSFSGWLMKIAYNAYLQAQRKVKREREINEQLAAERRAVYSDQTDLQSDVLKLLAVLSEQERIVMVLCYAHGFSHGEIAEIVGMPLGTVKSHIRRGRLKILEKQQLEESA